MIYIKMKYKFIFFRAGVTTRSAAKLETVEVHFHVLVSKEFLRSVNDDWVIIKFMDQFSGQWTHLQYRLHPKE